MTQEQKAKAYDEAIEKAKKELQTCGSTDCDAARQIYRFFPELKESKDEMIREKLIEFFKARGKRVSHCWGLSIPDILAWLENQPIISPEEMRDLLRMDYSKGRYDTITEAVEWLKIHINDYLVKGRDIDYMFDDFRKAMEE